MTLKQETEDVQYSDKDFNKIDAKCIGIETLYEKCENSFFKNLNSTNT